MTHLRTPAESALYAAEADRHGYVPAYAQVFALAPQAYQAWTGLGAAVRRGMDERRYELVTVAAASAMGARYCVLAHAAVLRDRHLGDTQLRAVLTDHHAAGLDDTEVAVMDFAARIATDPASATAEEIESLRGHGLSESDIFQVILAVCVRRFFAGALAAAGTVPDPELAAIAAVVAARP
ncbi:carboxymuconolactone decarboxylase family protein [Micromonospora palythoicola]|uniref:carboxymuconolactone decarboxylase family protein n=1 Tax=Micromonospora palythoicola TaxID=3120507 RepID=UPI002FCE19EE